MKPHDIWFIVTLILFLICPMGFISPNELFGMILFLFGLFGGLISFMISMSLHYWYDDKVKYDNMVKENREHMEKMQNL